VLDLRTYLGLRLEELRNWADLTRDDVAKISDLDPRQIADYELYRVWPEPENLSRLVTALGVDIRDAFDFKENRTHSTLPLEQRLAKRGMERADKGRTRRSPRNNQDETS
jgi:transcriptional regulator with XRE-family HTH domain